MRTRDSRSRFVVAVAVALAVGGLAGAQSTSASIRGTVVDSSGPVAAADVTAVNVDSGFVFTATTRADGSFTLQSLPPGVYQVSVGSAAYAAQTQTVQVLLGQELTVRFELSPSGVFMGDVTVVGQSTRLLVDTRSSTVATNITPEQMESLPINNRNFLAFAGLAPGVRFTDDNDAQGQGFRSGGANPKQVNVFIDGVSYKNDIIQGGAFMQDASRGNPFPQSAVQEYRVLTQNYKAEYEKASAAVITAVTKSGGNQFHGDVFYLYQDKDMVSQDDFARERGDEKPPYERKQLGLTVGGPIIQDKLHFFVTYEQNKRDVVSSVYRGGDYDSAPADVRAELDGYPTGSLSAPLDSKLFFGKLSWQPTGSQSAELTYHRRDETETRGFGGQRVKEGASHFEVDTDAVVARHQAVFGNALNEATATYQDMQWHDTAVDPTNPHRNYVGLLDVGGKDYLQNLGQKKVGIRDDFSYLFDWLGSHSAKAGVSISWYDYNLSKAAYGNPYFEYRQAEDWQYPYLARYGFGDPDLAFDNTQYGVFIQDDWRPLDNLTVNIGVRWDYETNMLNNDWVTPADVVQGLRTSCRTYPEPIGGQTEWCVDDIFNIDDYVSTGSNRTSYQNMFQPRLGFSWDVTGEGKTVVFGGWGLYYDRVTLNDIYDEQYRHVYQQYTFCFTEDGTQPDGCSVPAITWDPSYLSADGLAGLIASGQTPGPEVYLLANDTKPPRSIQWTLGLRQQLGQWVAGLTYANTRGANGLSWGFGTLPEEAPFNDRWGDSIPIPGYGLVLRSSDVRHTWYDGYFLTLDKPFDRDSNWGFNFAYTYSKAYQEGTLDEGVAFSFDYVSPHDFYKFPANADERHRVVASGTLGLPWGFTTSGIITLGSGTPITYTDCTNGWDVCVTHFNGARPDKQDFIIPDAWAYRTVDLRLEWQAPPIAKALELTLIGEAFNVFNFDNYGCFDGWAGAPGEPNPNFLKPNCEYNTRRYQVGARLSF